MLQSGLPLPSLADESPWFAERIKEFSEDSILSYTIEDQSG